MRLAGAMALPTMRGEVTPALPAGLRRVFPEAGMVALAMAAAVPTGMAQMLSVLALLSRKAPCPIGLRAPTG
jgi:hypothetical protein